MRTPVTRPGSRSRGFTLIELMITVAIVGVLATLAVVSYRRFVTSSHVTEGTQMVNSIRQAQESYHAETGQYVSVSSSLVDFCPATHAAGTKSVWDPTCGSVAKWQALPVRVDGPVMFGYATIAGAAGAAAPAVPTGMSTQGPKSLTAPAATDWFVISAQADVDKNGIPVTVLGVSWTNAVYVDAEGE